MPRNLPGDLTIDDLRDIETHDVVDITLNDGTTLHVGTANLVATDNTPYAAAIIDTSVLKQSLTKAADSVAFKIQNVDKQIGLTINEVQSTLVGAEIVYARAFRKLNSLQALFYKSIMLVGEISDVQITETDAEVTAISDMASGVAFIGNRPVQSRCPLVFKGVACGYVGGLTTCNKLLQSDDGCSGRNNTHRFGGIVIKGELPQPIFGRGPGSVVIGEDWGGDITYPDPLDGRHRALPLRPFNRT